MTKRTVFAAAVLVAVAAGVLWFGRAPGAYHETFDTQGSWGLFGVSNPEGMGSVESGAYYMAIPSPRQRVWALAGRHYGNAIYSVEAVQLEGPARSGYGLVWRAGEDTGRNRFYFFVITGAGTISAGYCVNDCAGQERNLTQGTWLATEAIRLGHGKTNTLAVRAEDADFTFYINGEEVWQAHDAKFAEGDIGVILESYEKGGPLVYFDNYKVEPLD